MMDNKPSSTGSSKAKSIHSVQFEYNVAIESVTCSGLCSYNLFLSCILFFTDICFEFFLLLQWINNEYYIPVFILSFFILLSNIINIIQWYSFNINTRFTFYHTIIIFGLIGLLPWIYIIYYLSYSCINYNKSNHIHMHNKRRRIKVISRSKSDHHNDDKTNLLLPQNNDNDNASGSIPPSTDIYHDLLSNVTQLLVFQAFIRTLPSIFIEALVLITVKLNPSSLFLTGFDSSHLSNIFNININIPSYLDALLINDLSVSHFISISLALLTYSYITISYLDYIQDWQTISYSYIYNKLFQFIQIVFIIIDCLIRIISIILILQCSSISIIYILIGFEILWSIEVVLWNNIYLYFSEYPSRKVYPFLFNAITEDAKDNIVMSPSSVINIKSIRNNDNNNGITHLSISSDQYQSPLYVKDSNNMLSPQSNNDIMLHQSAGGAAISASSSRYTNNKYTDNDIDIDDNDNDDFEPIIWVRNDISSPTVKLNIYEWKSLFYSLLGGSLGCISGWLIARSLRYCISNKQYIYCMSELFIRYGFSIILIIIYCNEYNVNIFKYESNRNYETIWPIICCGCLMLCVPYFIIIHWTFRPEIRRKLLKQYHDSHI